MDNAKHENGRCAMRGSCGSLFTEIPCVDNGLADEPTSSHRALLEEVCGPRFAQGPVCCTQKQVQSMQDKFQQAYTLISSCPACRNNFRDFFCEFTCSSDQSTFINITRQQGDSDKPAVKSVDFVVSERYGAGFYNSCASVQFGALNGYALDLIAPGAKNYHDFLSKLGEEKPLIGGSPFQIDFPQAVTGLSPLSVEPRSCADSDLDNKCPCIHCPEICPELPPPTQGGSCRVGELSCLSFIILVAYSLALVVFLAGFIFGWRVRPKARERRSSGSEGDSLSNNLLSPLSRSRALNGVSSTSSYDNTHLSQEVSDSYRLGRGASLLDPAESLQPRQYRLNTALREAFYRLGYFCATRPWITLATLLAVLGLLNIGWQQFEVETDPVQLWVSATSKSKLNKEYFDKQFGPFYRVEQIFLSSSETTSAQAVPVLNPESIRWWIEVEQQIKSLSSRPNGYRLSDICFKPLGENTPCAIQSISAWFGNDPENVEREGWKQTLTDCALNPADPNCLPGFKQPLTPDFVLGGIPQGDNGREFVRSAALVMTIPVNNHDDPLLKERAIEWESTLNDVLMQLSETDPLGNGLKLSFSTGVSLENELNKSTNTDIPIVALSYVVMFIYIAFALGSYFEPSRIPHSSNRLTRWLIRATHRRGPDSADHITETPHFATSFSSVLVGSKVLLGLCSIALVGLSISSTVAFFSLLGIRTTLIIAEVIPFLILAVGVDNVFLLVHELDSQNRSHGLQPGREVDPMESGEINAPLNTPDSIAPQSYLPPNERVAMTLAKMGPSILLSSLTQTIAFALGAIVPMPAVRNFALYAAGSVFLNATLQMSALISILALDLERTEAYRVDCLPCVRLDRGIRLPHPEKKHRSMLSSLLHSAYKPILRSRIIGFLVIFLFAGVFVASVLLIQNIELGFDQRLAIPKNSHLVDYFDSMDAFYNVGPPVYFVAKGVDVLNRTGQQLLCADFTTCSLDSVVNRIEGEHRRIDVSALAQPPASWIDDFFNWLNPLNECCRVKTSDPSIFCGPRDRRCQPCYKDKVPAWNITMTGFPQGEEMLKYLQRWLDSPPSEDCPLAGKAAYGSALAFNAQQNDVVASHFRTYNSPLKQQSHFIEAFQAAHRIAEDLSLELKHEVITYSNFHVFFEQYSYIVGITREILGLGLGVTLLVTAVFLGSGRTGLLVTISVGMTVSTVMAVMSLWGIMLNAISLVNLVISLGIAVEFCSHIARAFMAAGTGLPVDHPGSLKEREARVLSAMADVGPSVLTGITFTKLIGISVLAFSRSKLLQIYYFRMWITLIVSGVCHGFLLLPVLLTWAGGPGYTIEDEDEEWLIKVTRRHDYEIRPFRDQDSILSEQD